MAARQVLDGEAPLAEHHRPLGMIALVVGTSMSERGTESPRERGVDGAPAKIHEARDAAHAYRDPTRAGRDPL